MSSKFNGLQSHIKQQNNQSLFIWCHVHRLNLNLVIATSTSKGVDALNLFGNMESLYSFLWYSKKRGNIFREQQSKLNTKEKLHSMKKVATTRWMSHASALNTVLTKFVAIIKTLEIIRKTEGPYDAKVGSTASGFLKYFKLSKFVCISIFLFKIF